MARRVTTTRTPEVLILTELQAFGCPKDCCEATSAEGTWGTFLPGIGSWKCGHCGTLYHIVTEGPVGDALSEGELNVLPHPKWTFRRKRPRLDRKEIEDSVALLFERSEVKIEP